MEEKNRKRLRHEYTDYSAAGAYFITICTKNKECILGHIPFVGDGALDVPCVELSPYGKLVENEIIKTNCIYKDMQIEYSVIMPNHVHMIVLIHADSTVADGTSGAPSPTDPIRAAGLDQSRMYQGIPRLISTLKRFVNKQIGKNIWQRSFFDHVIRDRKEYDAYCRYVYENPLQWQRGEHSADHIDFYIV